MKSSTRLYLTSSLSWPCFLLWLHISWVAYVLLESFESSWQVGGQGDPCCCSGYPLWWQLESLVLRQREGRLKWFHTRRREEMTSRIRNDHVSLVVWWKLLENSSSIMKVTFSSHFSSQTACGRRKEEVDSIHGWQSHGALNSRPAKKM